jgi:hypothetical protein
MSSNAFHVSVLRIDYFIIVGYIEQYLWYTYQVTAVLRDQ